MNKKDHKDIARQIKTFIRDERMFRDINISRKTLCERLNIGNTLLSQIMEQEFKMSLPVYLNKCRATHAKRLLNSDAHKDNTLDEIALLSGFKTRSALHRAFVKFFNNSPGEIRKKGELQHCHHK